ncbi:hypothetical protein VOLCADRAFT_103027 [Volvox carteri f. nagariensis]|uniref:Uncharacterized protein n=1 Tax=Volvox carteri f. nagariensis TaxID=3068 RepID=D8TJF9_VOLCA|nr:uncharacterized protein VOLCADRAFT_103027 [Volvox carteri f. nagariensis]EFJ52535.1 hypothetical protein VOLCADRAFT_103027 [Volvox carteri f. nagariensis]|eukprot:XP_002946608.1 hypothetical protein VOLCADRAFT_103027 [Volvox carteri f. nagariensis]
MAAAPTNLLLAQNFTADLNNLGRANSPAISGGPVPGAAAQNGLQFQTREEAQMFLQAAGRAQPNGANAAGGIALTRDAVAALQHAAQVAAVNQAKMVPHGNGNVANGTVRSSVPVVPPLGQGQNPALANLHTQAQLQAAMNAQRAAAQAAVAQQTNGLSAANNQAALFLVQNQLAQAQAANNAAQVNPFGLQNGLQNNPIAAAAAAAAAVAASTQAAQARAAAVGNANLLQLQQAAQAAGLQRPQAMAWAQNQALQNAAIAQHNLAQQNLAAAQNNPALLAAALQAQQARAALQVQQLAAQQQAAAAAAARPLAPAQPSSVAAAQQLQALRQLQARLNAAQAPNALAAAATPAAPVKPTEAQIQILRTALARSAAGRAALNAANVLGAGTPRAAVPPASNGTASTPALNPLQQAINIQLLLQQQRNVAQVQQAQVTAAMANNLAANIQNNAAAALNGQLAALQQAAAANAVANGQRSVMPGNTAAALASIGGANAGVLNEAMLQNLQKLQLAKAMQDSAAAAVTGLSMPAVDKVATSGGDASSSSNSSKEQRRLALACVALQLARGGMTVEQAIQSGIMGGMSVTDVKFIVECYNAERQRMQSEGVPGAVTGSSSGGGAAAGGTPQQSGAPPQQGVSPGLPGGPGSGHGVATSGMPGLPGHLMGHVDLGLHGISMGSMGAPPGMVGHHGMAPNGMHQPPLPYAHSPSAPGSPAVGESKDAVALAAATVAAAGGASRLGPISIPGHSSAPVSPPRTASQGSPTNNRIQITGPGSDVDGGGHETRSEGGASAELAADAAAAVAALAKESFDAFSYGFFGTTEGPAMGELLGELETGGAADGELESGAVAALDAEGDGEPGGIGLGGPSPLLGELDPDQAAWLRAAASANQAMWAGEGAEDGPISNDEIAARLANLDLGSGFF